jgi:hypothetical protein
MPWPQRGVTRKVETLGWVLASGLLGFKLVQMSLKANSIEWPRRGILEIETFETNFRLYGCGNKKR